MQLLDSTSYFQWRENIKQKTPVPVRCNNQSSLVLMCVAKQMPHLGYLTNWHSATLSVKLSLSNTRSAALRDLGVPPGKPSVTRCPRWEEKERLSFCQWQGRKIPPFNWWGGEPNKQVLISAEFTSAILICELKLDMRSCDQCPEIEANLSALLAHRAWNIYCIAHTRTIHTQTWSLDAWSRRLMSFCIHKGLFKKYSSRQRPGAYTLGSISAQMGSQARWPNRAFAFFISVIIHLDKQARIFKCRILY